MLGTTEITLEDVLRAGRILFGPSFDAERRGWREALRATYRRRALETHPDRARALGRCERELSRDFEDIADAYRILAAVRVGPLPRSTVGAPRPVARRSAAPSRQPPRPAQTAHGFRADGGGPAPPRGRAVRPSGGAPAERARAGAPRVRAGVRPEDLPRRRLRFAEFLYYSGRVRFSELVEALVWQRAQRPPLGKILVEFGFLRPDDVAEILWRRPDPTAGTMPFGERAIRLGYLRPFQVLCALGQQARRQRPIGQFFVERGIVLPGEIDGIRRRILRHNSRFRA